MHDRTKRSVQGLLILLLLSAGQAEASDPAPAKPAGSSKKKDNFFTTPSAGAGAAFAGAANLGYYLGALAGGPTVDWQGYPKGGPGLEGSADGVGMTYSGNDCALAGVSQLAQVLKQAPPQEVAEGSRPSSGSSLTTLKLPEREKQAAYDGKDVYQASAPVTCAQADGK